MTTDTSINQVSNQSENFTNQLYVLDFEKDISEIENKINTLKQQTCPIDADIVGKLARLEEKRDSHLNSLYSNLNPWQTTQVARHPNRPHFSDYLKGLFTDFESFSGDRLFQDDDAIIAGPARFKGCPVMVIGQEKGNNLETRLKHNFGMARPEGYRKAKRLMELADKFSLPILTFVDTSGAYPGVDAEERGQGWAISDCIATCLSVSVPIISTVIGEGGSGGAIALAAANKVLMLENAIYSVISPEGCAAILWKDRTKANLAAEALKITAKDLFSLGIIDEIIKEPLGAAHRNHNETIKNVEASIDAHLKELLALPKEQIRPARHDKFMKMTIIR